MKQLFSSGFRNAGLSTWEKMIRWSPQTLCPFEKGMGGINNLLITATVPL